MSSLAEKLRSRHLESQGGLKAQPPAETTQPARATPEPEAVRERLEEGEDVQGPARGAGTTKPSRAPNPATSAANSALFADLPRLKASARTITPGVSAWGSGTNGSGPSARASSANAAPANGPQIVPSKQSVVTVALETPEERSAMLEAVRAVSQDLGVKIEVGKSAVPRNATFMIKGPTAAITAQARDELEASLQPEVSVTLEIPSSSRAAIIGQRGSVLRSLESKHKVSIELSAPPATSASTGSVWSLERTLVTVSGRESNVAAARHAIIGLVDSARRVSSTRELTRECAQVLRHNAQWASFINASLDAVTLNGSFADVSSSMAELDAVVRAMETDYVRRRISLDEARGQRAHIPESLAQQIMQTTSAVVLADSSEVYGPKTSVDAAVAALEKFLQTQIFTQLDIAQAHGRDVSHARMLARYLAAKGEIERIAAESRGTVTISAEPTIDDHSVVYAFAGDEKAVSKARAALKRVVNAHSPSSVAVIRGMRHPLVRKRAAESLKQLDGPISGFIGPSDELYLEYCEPEDDFALSDDEVKEHILAARALLAPLAELADSLTKKKIVLNNSDVQFALKPFGSEATALWDQVIRNSDVEIEAAEPVETEGEKPKTYVVLNGTKSAVNEAAEALPKILQLSRQYGLLASHVEELVIDPTLVRNLIGKGGSQIQKFRDEFDVKIDVDDAGHVRVQGVKAQARACAKAIAEMQRRLRDETTERLSVPVALHAKLIGPRGKHVRRLSEQHQCIIKFPKARQDSVDSPGSESPLGASGSEANLASDEPEEDVIFIRGPSRGVAAIKREFMDLVNYERAQSYVEEMSVPGSVVSRLVGRGGVGINTIRQNTGVQIDVGTATSNDEDVKIVVTGEPKAVKSAMAQLRASADAAIDFAEKFLDVPQEYHKFLTGPQNSTRRRLVSEAGGDAENAGKILIIPNQGSSSDQVRLAGPSAVVTKLETSVLDLVADVERHLKEEGVLEVPRNRLRHIVGAEGQKKKLAEKTYDVYINIPRGHGSDSVPVSVQVSGETKESVTKAIDYLRELALPSESTIEIPVGIWSQKFRSQVMSKYKVRIDQLDAAGASAVPKKPEDASFLIVSSANGLPTHKLRIHAKSEDECREVENFIKKGENVDTLCYLWLKPQQISTVVGTGGKTIKKIRSESGCNIEVPGVASDAPITITGSKAKVEATKDMLIAAASSSQ